MYYQPIHRSGGLFLSVFSAIIRRIAAIFFRLLTLLSVTCDPVCFFLLLYDWFSFCNVRVLTQCQTDRPTDEQTKLSYRCRTSGALNSCAAVQTHDNKYQLSLIDPRDGIVL